MSEPYASLDGERVISGLVQIPLRGLWTADVVLASPEPVAERPTLKLGNLTLKAARFRAASYGGARSVRIVGGADGWRKDVGPKAYVSPISVRLSTVLGDVANEVGESVDVTADGDLGSKWTRLRGTASRSLDVLTGQAWFMRPDGTTVTGDRPASAIKSAFTVTQIAGADGRVVVGTEDFASWQPAATFTPPILGVQVSISSVIHRINDGVIRTEILFDGGTSA